MQKVADEVFRGMELNDFTAKQTDIKGTSLKALYSIRQAAAPPPPKVLVRDLSTASTP